MNKLIKTNSLLNLAGGGEVLERRNNDLSLFNDINLQLHANVSNPYTFNIDSNKNFSVSTISPSVKVGTIIATSIPFTVPPGVDCISIYKHCYLSEYIYSSPSGFENVFYVGEVAKILVPENFYFQHDYIPNATVTNQNYYKDNDPYVNGYAYVHKILNVAYPYINTEESKYYEEKNLYVVADDKNTSTPYKLEVSGLSFAYLINDKYKFTTITGGK